MTRVSVSPLADRDLEAIVDHYLQEAGVEVAASFLSAWDHSRMLLREQPDIGSPRLAEASGIPNLRTWPIKRFPHLILYRHIKGAITILRVLHTARDIPASLQG